MWEERSAVEPKKRAKPLGSQLGLREHTSVGRETWHVKATFKWRFSLRQKENNVFTKNNMGRL